MALVQRVYVWTLLSIPKPRVLHVLLLVNFGHPHPYSIMKSFVSATAALSLASSALAATYSIVDTYTSDNFLTMFDFEAVPDPTAGRV